MGPLSGYRIVELAGIGPARCARCCSRTWAPMCSESIAPRTPVWASRSETKYACSIAAGARSRST